MEENYYFSELLRISRRGRAAVSAEEACLGSLERASRNHNDSLAGKEVLFEMESRISPPVLFIS